MDNEVNLLKIIKNQDSDTTEKTKNIIHFEWWHIINWMWKKLILQQYSLLQNCTYHGKYEFMLKMFNKIIIMTKKSHFFRKI